MFMYDHVNLFLSLRNDITTIAPIHLKSKCYTSLEFQKTRKSDYQLFSKQTSEGILGINTCLWQFPHKEENSETTAERTY